MTTTGRQARNGALAFVPDYPIETARLSLRPFTRADVDAVYAYRRREDVARYLNDEAMTHETCTDVVRIRTGQQTLAEEMDRVVLAITRREDGLLIGEMSLILRDACARQAELGYVLHPDHQGRGHATEAARAMLDLAFSSFSLHRVYACCAAANTASWHVMERLGMRREGHLREHQLVKGAWYEEFIYALLAREWDGKRP